MGAVSYKCPNCGGELVFDPSSQHFACPYCGSSFSLEDLENLHVAEGSESYAQPEEDTSGSEWTQEHPDEDGQTSDGEGVIYSCPSCGAEIVTSETTAATYCYYCHNPVVLKGRVSGEYLPDSIIPFQVGRDKALDKFRSYIRGKRFVPKDFYDGQQIEKLTGVYYPYWVYDCTLDGRLEGTGTKVRVWRTGDTEYTETSRYRARREGAASLRNLTRNALQGNNRDLAERVQPYRLSDRVPFTMAYLSGFMAERRDMERDVFEQELRTETAGYADHMLRGTIGGYSTFNVNSEDCRRLQEGWHYTLFPVWVLTYTRGSQVYYYAMNGQTGQTTGRLPVDRARLAVWAAIITVVVTALVMILMWYI